MWKQEKQFMNLDNPIPTKPNYKRLSKNGIWLDKKGNRLKISEMRTQHIHNCIKLILNYRISDRYCYIPVMSYELQKRNSYKTAKEYVK